MQSHSQQRNEGEAHNSSQNNPSSTSGRNGRMASRGREEPAKAGRTGSLTGGRGQNGQSDNNNSSNAIRGAEPQDQMPNSQKSGDTEDQFKRQKASSNASKGYSSTQETSQSRKVHDAIVDLYLQVKIRSNEEIDMFEQDQFASERERLGRLDSLTVLNYIRTSIEILMQMKLDEEKEHGGARNAMLGRMTGGEGGAASEFTSTFQSIDLPPKEYEQQLQQYEAEVRNHIKVEQQLKLHIEVLQEKIDELEKGKGEFETRLAQEKKDQEKKLKAGFARLLDQKQAEVEKLQRDIKKQRDLVNASLERGRQDGAHHSTSHVKVVRLNNFVGGSSSNNTTKSNKSGRAVAQSHSPSGLTASSDKSVQQPGQKIKKGLKVANQVGKSPYLNDCFKKGINQQSTSTNQSELSSSSSAKANRKGAASAEISESSMIVLKKSTKANAVGTVQTINSSSVKPVDNMKLMAAIQRMRQINPSSQSQIPQKMTPGQSSGSNGKIVSLADSQQRQPLSNTHKKNAKSQNTVSKLTSHQGNAQSRQGNDSVGTNGTSGGAGNGNRGSQQEDNVATMISAGKQMQKKKLGAQYNSMDGGFDVKQDSEMSQATVVNMTQQELMNSSGVPIQNHNSLIDQSNQGTNMILTQGNLSGSQNLGSSLNKGSSKPSVRTQGAPLQRSHQNQLDGKVPGSASSKKATGSRKSQNSNEMIKQNTNPLMKQMSHQNEIGPSQNSTGRGIGAERLSSKNAAYTQQSQKQRNSSKGASVSQTQSEPDVKHEQNPHMVEAHSNSTIQDFMMAQQQSQSQHTAATYQKSLNSSQMHPHNQMSNTASADESHYHSAMMQAQVPGLEKSTSSSVQSHHMQQNNVAANQQDFISQYAQGAHHQQQQYQYHLQGASNQPPANNYHQMQQSSNSVMQNSGSGGPGKVRNPSMSTNIQQQHSAGGMNPPDGTMKNYKKAAATASRTRPRSQLSHIQ